MSANQRIQPFLGTRAASGPIFTLPNESDVLAIFSLRRYAGYTGNCIRVNRSSDGTNLDIGFVGDIIDTASIISFCSGSTGRVEIWYNQIGNGNDAYQGTQSLRPIIYESGSLVTEGGLPSLNWTATQLLNLLSPIDIESAFLVYRLSTTAQTLITLAIGATNDQIWAGGTFTGVNGFAIRENNITRVTNTTENTNYNLSSFFGGSDHRIDTNASDPASAGSAFGTMTIANLGRSSNGVTGKYHEVIFYSTSQFSEKSTIENMINDYYSIY